MLLSARGLVLVFFFLSGSLFSHAQRHETEPFDVLNYRFDVVLDKDSDRIDANAWITICYPDEIPSQTLLDLASPTNTGIGMKVEEVNIDGAAVSYSHDSDQLKVKTPSKIQKGDTIVLKVSYAGKPDNGMVIKKNSRAGRTYFAEHWPNRAHRWLPVVDHPSEKATCEFRVTAPARYAVISNGEKQKETLLDNDLKQTIWKMDRPIPTKVMVIGVADFNTHVLDDEGMITAWVYDKPGNRALSDFGDAPKIFDLLVDLMGEYPFSKCDQVESTTRFGGMENAGNIFYPERLLTGKHQMNHTIAHEIGHQWFGNSVSEAGWSHVWISEGFATFLEYYYVENHEGKEAFLSKLDRDEQKVLNYQYRFPGRTIVQRNFDPLEDILNPMVYEKAAWALRMLRAKIGEDNFKQIILAFYEKYKFGNATTEDFMQMAKELSSVDLTDFFHQWFYVPGTPSIDYRWKYRGGKLILEFHQKTAYTFKLDVDIEIKYGDNDSVVKRVVITEKDQEIALDCEKPKQVAVDPSNIILGEFWRR